jgi:hypothetical protein
MSESHGGPQPNAFNRNRGWIVATLTAMVAVGTVLLHAVGAIAHSRYLWFWGVDPNQFPKTTDWTLIFGYYAIFDRAFAALSGVVGGLLWFLGAALLAAAYVTLLLSVGSGESEGIKRVLNALPERFRSAARRFVLSFLVLCLLPIALAVITALMGVPGALGESAGKAFSERKLVDFRKGCAQSSAPCVELRRDGSALVTGYLLDSSDSHVAILDAANKQARTIPLAGVELVVQRVKQ